MQEQILTEKKKRKKGRCITSGEVRQILQSGAWRCRWQMAEAIGMVGEDPVIMPVVQELFKGGHLRRKKMRHPCKKMFVYYYQLKRGDEL